MANLRENSCSLLAATTVPFNAAAAVTLYTVPTGKRCLLHAVEVVAGTDAAVTLVSVGASGALTDFVATSTLSSLDTLNDCVILMPVPSTTPAKLKSYAAATPIQMNVITTSGGASNTVYTYGMIY